MNLMKLFLIIFILKISILSIELLEPLKNYNKTCENQIDCGSLKCTNKLCKCPIGYIWKSQYKACSSFEFELCKYAYECQDQDPNTICTSIKLF